MVAEFDNAAPADAQSWFQRGRALGARNELAPAVAAYRRALELDPQLAEAWSNLGALLGALGERAEEIQAYRRAIGINPRLAPVWSNLANALREEGAHAEAVAACRRALELEPEFAAAWNNLAGALLAMGQHDEAITAGESALRLAPGVAEVWSTLGAALHGAGRYDEAVRILRKSIQIQPDNARAHFFLGVTLQHCGRHAEAIASLRRALEIQPDHAQAHWDLSFSLLSAGRLAEGWQEYEWRWRREGARPRRHDFAAWDGDAARPRRLLLWAEQGVGDQIIYGSMLADLVASPLRITLEVDPRLAPLFQRSFPRIAVVPGVEPSVVNPADHDCQAPLGSLGVWLRRSFESFPRHRGFLTADPRRASAYRSRLRGPAGERIVGISWRSANAELGPFKSSGLSDWLRVLQAPGARFVDLQYGDTEAERAQATAQSAASIEHLPDLDLYQDLDGLAALCAACDLVITASNVTAHVAGALGRPVWLLVPLANGKLWYWFSDRTDSPWYPSMRIFTQSRRGDWQPVLDTVARELAAFRD